MVWIGVVEPNFLMGSLEGLQLAPLGVLSGPDIMSALATITL